MLFDPRDGWVLLSEPLGARPRKRVLQWMHPDDVRFEWVRNFTFSNAAPAGAETDQVESAVVSQKTMENHCGD